MNYIIYPSNIKNTNKGPINEIDPLPIHCKHTTNSLILRLICKRGNTFNLRQRANIELEICEKKIIYWEKKLNAEAISISLAASQKVLPDYIQTYATLLKWT